jgi:outer membrane protein
VIAALGALTVIVSATGVCAQTMAEALAGAYATNPEINSARASARATDESVPLALSGYRPIISMFSDTSVARSGTGQAGYTTSAGATIGLTLSQPLFSGFRVRNSVRQAEANVLASRELLDNTVQNVLFDTAQVYQDILRDLAILDLRQRNQVFLDAQVNAANERLNVGEGTRTDVAQARARFASARAGVSLAEATLETSRAAFVRLVGREPGRLTGGFPYARLIPADLQQAIGLGQNEHPVIRATIHQADAQAFAVKRIEGELLPTVSLDGSLVHDEDFRSDIDPNAVSVSGRVSIPIYQGGAVSARVREAKEQYGLRKIEIDLARDQVRAAVVSAWAQANAAARSIDAAAEGVTAAETALTGVQEELKVGQRTTLDVLDAQQELLNAQETLILARRDSIVASFAVLSAMGRLTAEQLNLPVEAYDPTEHYRAVRDKWFGLRTPDGR